MVSSTADLHLVRRVHGQRFPRMRQLGRLGRVLNPRERLLLRSCIVLLIIGAGWLTLNVAKKYREHVPAVGGQYTEGVVGSPQLVNPLFASLNDVDQDITRLVYSGLMRYDEKLRLVPDLAVKCQSNEDKKIYTCELRRDVLWHDGQPFTAKDVLYTIEAIQDPAVNSPLFVTFQGVIAEAVDDFTVKFTLQEPFAPFLGSLTVGILPEHVWAEVPGDRLRLHKSNLQPLGTGPFAFKRLFKDNNTGYIYRYELTRNSKYYRQAPYIQEFNFQFFSDFDGDAGAIQALREQKIDGIHFVPKEFRDRVERKHIQLYTLQLPQYTALFFNQNHGPLLQDKNVRMALARAIDKDRVLRETLKDKGQVIHGPLLEGFPGYSADIAKIPYSLDEASKLLDEKWTRVPAEQYRAERKEQIMKELRERFPTTATSTVSPTGETIQTSTTTMEMALQKEADEVLSQELEGAQTFYRKNKQGEVLEVTLVTTETKEYQQAAELIAGLWQDIGVKTNIKFVPSKDLSRSVLRPREYDILLYGLLLGNDPDQYPFWHSSQIDYPGLNVSRYVNRSVDTMLQKIRETDNEEERANLYKQFQDALLADLPAIFLYTPTYTYATSDGVQGISLQRIHNPSDRFANVTNWYVETKGKWKFGE